MSRHRQRVDSSRFVRHRSQLAAHPGARLDAAGLQPVFVRVTAQEPEPPKPEGRVYGPPPDRLKEAMEAGNNLEHARVEGKRQ